MNNLQWENLRYNNSKCKLAKVIIQWLLIFPTSAKLFFLQLWFLGLMI
jgi:hypothetical protein